MTSQIVHLFCLLAYATRSQSQSVVSLRHNATASIPPKITLNSEEDIYYKVNETVKITCEASGQPHPGFSWKRQEIDFNPAGNDDRITQTTNKGTLIINSPEDKDEGIYQCFATNAFGTAVSHKFNLRMAKLNSFGNNDPITHNVQLGAYLPMSCQSPDSVPDAEIYWVVEQKDGGYHVLDWNSTVSMDYEDRIHFAHVTKLNRQDGQPYRCIVYNKMMRRNQVGPPQYIKPTGATDQKREISFVWPMSRFNQFGLVGSTKRLKCIFAGNPTPIVRWSRADKKPLPLDRVTTANSDGQELQITNLQFEDAGSYVCEATAKDSSTPVRSSFNLTVNSRPTWLKKPQDVESGEGATAVFECKAAGVPAPEIKWFVNGQKLEDALRKDNRLDSRFKRLQPTKIVFERVTKEDTMVFQCNATNVNGHVWGEAYLNVLDEAPKIIEVTGGAVTVAEGQPFEVRCAVIGKPDPIITWFKNAVQITGGRYLIRETGDLFVKRAVLSDAGIFTCEAVNKFDRVTAVAGTVIVRRKTLIEQAPRDLEVRSKAYAKFTCSGTTDPEETENLRIIWLKDYKAIEVGERFFTNPQDNSLILSGAQVRDTGTVTCVLTNGLDNNTASARLEVTDVPNQPYELKLINTCKIDMIAQLTWIPGSFNNAPIQYFTVEYTTTKDPGNWNFISKVNQTKSTDDIKLAYGLDYKFRVISVNRIGMSTPSLPTSTSCVTNSNVSTQHPMNARTIGDVPGSIHLEWTPVLPIHQGGLKFWYTIFVRQIGVSEGSSLIRSITISDWKQSSLLIPGVSVDYEAYNITMKSNNEKGDSSLQPTVFVGHSAEAMPIISPTNLENKAMTFDTVSLQWTFPRREIGRLKSKIKGEFNGFQIQMWQLGRRVETIRQWILPASDFTQGHSDVFNATINHMMPNTNVEATVAVVNNFFIGKPSDSIRFLTLPGLPSPVSYMEADVIGDNHITVSWKRPLDDRADLLGYDIGYQEVKRGLELSELQEVRPSIDDPYASDAMVTGLMPKTKYRIHIWAKTAAGRGESYFIERTTLSAVELELPWFTIADVGNDHINVSWWADRFKESGSVIYVEYKKEDGAEWLSTSPDVTKSWANIRFLQPGMTYQIRVVVTNGKAKRVSVEEDVETHGVAAGYDVVANLGWFLSIVFALLINIVLIVLFCMAYKKGFRFKTYEERHDVRTYNDRGNTYTDTDKLPRKSEDFGPEPAGHSNDYYDERDNYNYGAGGNDKHEDFDHGRGHDDYYRDNEKPPPGPDEYEDYNQYDNNYNDSDDIPVKPRAYSDEGSNPERPYDKDGYNYDDYDDDRRYYDDDRDRQNYGNNDRGRAQPPGYDDYNDDRYYDDENEPNSRHSNRGYNRDDQSDREHDRSRDGSNGGTAAINSTFV